jgi:hypothetical protein
LPGILGSLVYYKYAVALKCICFRDVSVSKVRESSNKKLLKQAFFSLRNVKRASNSIKKIVLYRKLFYDLYD